jgi:hypothetical protein
MTPPSLKNNIFIKEYKFLRCRENETSKKYDILYNILAPKLLQKPELIGS